MQFVLVIYHGTTPLPGTPAWKSLSQEQQKEAYADYEALNRMENLTPAPPLGLPHDATTVRVENGATVTTEGPYAGADGAVGGFYVLEAEDVETAVDIASRIPQARRGGAVEVRPSAKYW